VFYPFSSGKYRLSQRGLAIRSYVLQFTFPACERIRPTARPMIPEGSRAGTTQSKDAVVLTQHSDDHKTFMKSLPAFVNIDALMRKCRYC